MKIKLFSRDIQFNIATAGEEPVWQTAIGCAMVWAAFLTLCWML